MLAAYVNNLHKLMTVFCPHLSEMVKDDRATVGVWAICSVVPASKFPVGCEMLQLGLCLWAYKTRTEQLRLSMCEHRAGIEHSLSYTLQELH